MPHGLTTAPVNHAPPWPAGYLAVRGARGAREKTIAKCLGRVRRRRARGIRAGGSSASVAVLMLTRFATGEPCVAAAL